MPEPYEAHGEGKKGLSNQETSRDLPEVVRLLDPRKVSGLVDVGERRTWNQGMDVLGRLVADGILMSWTMRTSRLSFLSPVEGRSAWPCC